MVNEFFGSAADWASAMCYAAAAIGCLYALLAAWAARGFVGTRPNLAKKIYPAVTVLKPLSGTEFDLDVQLVLLAMGFVHPVHEGLLKTLGVDLDPRGNVRANFNDYQTSRPNVISAGDMRRGQSLVVWAIREGRLCARAIDRFLMGKSDLPA